MKLYLILCVALSLLGTVLSGPMPEYNFATEQFDGHAGISQGNIQDLEYPDVQSYADTQGHPPPPPPPPPYGSHEYDARAQSYADIQIGMPREGETKLPAKDIEELRKRMMPLGMEELAEAEWWRRHTVTAKEVMHGSTIMIRTDKANYLRCPLSGPGLCSTSTCPGMSVDRTDWAKCRENVFRIYHSNGPGVIRVGDYVAFYFPIDRKWFSMYTNRGHKQIQCPGYPNKIYGFHRRDSWFSCGSEVFHIHAEGKLDGQIIENQDYITLYYPNEGQYLRLDKGVPSLGTCPGKYPPNPLTYDRCFGEVFEITLP